MSLMSKQELLNIKAGNVTASYITALVRGINSLLDLGRSLGTAIRRAFTGLSC